MRAVAYDRVGGADVLRLVQLSDPVPGPGEVLIRVAYAGVNFAEVVARRGAGLPVPIVDCFVWIRRETAALGAQFAD